MKKVFAIGSYTTPGRAGIELVVVDGDLGTIAHIGRVEGVGNPIYFARNDAGNLLYVAQTPAPGDDRLSKGAVAAFRVGPGIGPEMIDLVEFPFSVPCHISLARDGTRILFAEYSAAHAGVVSLNPDGTFGGISTVHHEGHGPNKARQESAHCHCAVASPDGRLMFVCDLGTDTVKAYSLGEGPSLEPSAGNDFHSAPGFGPRHMVFDASGTHAYIVYELASAVQALAYDGRGLSPMQDPLPMLPEDFRGESKAAAIRISPCGKWLLASNRGHDSIAAFAIRDDGTLLKTPVISRLDGRFPRDFAFVDGGVVIVGHKLSDSVGLYSFDRATGALSRFGDMFAMPRPLAFACLGEAPGEMENGKWEMEN